MAYVLELKPGVAGGDGEPQGRQQETVTVNELLL